MYIRKAYGVSLRAEISRVSMNATQTSRKASLFALLLRHITAFNLTKNSLMLSSRRREMQIFFNDRRHVSKYSVIHHFVHILYLRHPLGPNGYVSLVTLFIFCVFFYIGCIIDQKCALWEDFYIYLKSSRVKWLNYCYLMLDSEKLFFSTWENHLFC